MNIFQRRKRSKNAGSSSSQQPQPVTFIPRISLTPNERDLYNNLMRRKVLATKFYDTASCRKLRVKTDIEAVFTSCGWGEFKNWDVRTYERPTREFLATLRKEQITEADEFEIAEYKLTFSLYNQRQEITLRRLNEIFGWDPEAEIFFPTSDCSAEYDHSDWWYKITGSTSFVTREVNASQIVHPVLRILHRLFGYTVFSKQDLSKVNLEELATLWISTHDPRITRGKVNWGWLFIKRCFEMRETSGDIQCGGLVTILAMGLELQQYLTLDTAVSGDPYFDTEAMKDRKFLRPAAMEGYYSWKVRGNHYCYLPNIEKTDLDREGNCWQFDSEPLHPMDAHNEPHAPPSIQPSPSVPGPSTSTPSSSSPFDLSSLGNALSTIDTRLAEQTYFQNQIYHGLVRANYVQPYLNYPHRPVQEGPIASWNDRGEPTFPYYPTPTSPGYDYRISGRYNPDYDPGTGVYPPGGGWQPHGPPPFGSYAPSPPRPSPAPRNKDIMNIDSDDEDEGDDNIDDDDEEEEDY